jgi:hypothetical protein
MQNVGYGVEKPWFQTEITSFPVGLRCVSPQFTAKHTKTILVCQTDGPATYLDHEQLVLEACNDTSVRSYCHCSSAVNNCIFCCSINTPTMKLGSY